MTNTSERVLTCARWFLDRKRITNGVADPVSIEEVSATHVVPFRFFDQEGLTTRTLIGDNDLVDEDFIVRVEDLTPEGYELFRTGYQKWLSAYARRTPEKRKQWLAENDVSILSKYLEIIRNRENQ
ncbi:hypothetical protein SAMN04488117_11854 [Celeribacter baekdonensis]|jgi:hypothetical protein|uniref:Uncharacterized protein n=1 Tax=Celeribacter baekdonensis TaxID=875171 RepID=A0A1G7TS98_9RHOB|nr:hypothetical protein [Celeribacter baekdonensis]MBU1279569.1 hypothetical protein [Alphaproteobacteria bacterium]MBU1571699.1 hypothetical protein [Alphaproteobacteria bacterium]MBU2241237.1 hypothetical protein [Alphaproteobacteria bacterium]SDG38196.1 hypothetical protein SAMN04488117_11854 [Celeribacter baekdonensis]|tara:strand:+ start:459 stop:836 length:378 start_codon:yes stop_codon:yes gene_type:complete